ncbi:MAG: DUF2127 domain-containing protein [Chloroflexota bacterium]|nr:DUF2127 domain-containing protein [Chloroflexota bacterium]
MDVSVQQPAADVAGKGTGRSATAGRVVPRGKREGQERLTVWLALIVALKSATALLLWIGFVLLLFARGSDPQTFMFHLAQTLFRGNPPGIAIRWLAANETWITPVQLTRFAIASATYALVESTEAVGLLLRKWWAEWLVILVTVSFIPLELFEIVARPTPLKATTLAINLAILWYLVRRLKAKHDILKAA